MQKPKIYYKANNIQCPCKSNCLVPNRIKNKRNIIM